MYVMHVCSYAHTCTCVCVCVCVQLYVHVCVQASLHVIAYAHGERVKDCVEGGRETEGNGDGVLRETGWEMRRREIIWGERARARETERKEGIGDKREERKSRE